jgi:DNA-binding transcriptional MocR family regulator
MTLSCRQKLVQLARRHDALIITDDVYDLLQWSTNNTSPLTRALIPRLVDVDRELGGHEHDAYGFGNTVSNGSFSKIVAPGCRTGWAEGSEKFVFGLSQAGSSRSGGAPSQLTATFIAEMLKSGDLQNHVFDVLQPAYARRYAVLIAAIGEHLVPLGITLARTNLEGKDIFGGYFVWIQLPDGLKAESVAAAVKERENTIVAHGNLFEVWGDERITFDSALRLCFAWEDEQDLIDGVRRLGRVVEAFLKGEIPRETEEKVDGSLKRYMGDNH